MITRQQSNQLRGFAIICIILTNFFRPLMGLDIRNVMQWDDANVLALFDGLRSVRAPVYALIYWAWYSVPVFIFLSGYGLTRKYGDGPVNAWRFTVGHLRKLLLLMIPVYTVFLLLNSVVYGYNYSPTMILKQFTLTINFLSPVINPGVYWFFGLMAQFYLAFLVLRRLNRNGLLIVLAASIACNYATLYLIDDSCIVWWRQNSIGWFSSFVFGMLVARCPEVAAGRWMRIVVPVLFVITSLVKCLHPFSPVLAIMSALLLIKCFDFKFLTFTGTISAGLFAVHPVMRLVFYNSLTHLPTVVRLALYLASTWLLAVLYVKVYYSRTSRK